MHCNVSGEVNISSTGPWDDPWTRLSHAGPQGVADQLLRQMSTMSVRHDRIASQPDMVNAVDQIVASIAVEAIGIEIFIAAVRRSRADGRLSVDACRQLLGRAGTSMSDQDVEKLREQIYALADIVVEAALERQARLSENDASDVTGTPPSEEM